MPLGSVIGGTKPSWDVTAIYQLMLMCSHNVSETEVAFTLFERCLAIKHSTYSSKKGPYQDVYNN